MTRNSFEISFLTSMKNAGMISMHAHRFCDNLQFFFSSGWEEKRGAHTSTLKMAYFVVVVENA